ncbi:hypothetical protein [Bradyrhizobium sp. CB2312]|uniref:hypothetical protein n=1 Tax=Bradyrhizobium sp. CB2312 TaxID=3039155 RepID=UPI0024B13B2C|nr:hypothetical protein [Bradyrhizobium sp. CB2312]WFU76390.1 hypothetical protein QA642_21495 [Bradyrhizobium sp. CB2312]
MRSRLHKEGDRMLACSDTSNFRNGSSEITEICARTRETVATSQEILKTPAPDTFLGRQHYALLSLPERDDDHVTTIAILLMAKAEEQ